MSAENVTTYGNVADIHHQKSEARIHFQDHRAHRRIQDMEMQTM